MAARISPYRRFWPTYVGEHSKALTRRLHFLGTLGALALIALALGPLPGWTVALAPVVAYGMAWLAHGLVEKNRPATFRQPFFSLIGDFHMCALMLRGRMDAEAARLIGRAREAA